MDSTRKMTSQVEGTRLVYQAAGGCSSPSGEMSLRGLDVRATDPCRTSTTLAMFSCMGGEIVIVTAGEAASPRRDIPQAARFMYLAPVGLYILMTFLLGLNINFLDPGLQHPWIESTSAASTSPFILVVRRAGIEVLPSVLNACFLVSAYTTA